MIMTTVVEDIAITMQNLMVTKTQNGAEFYRTQHWDLIGATADYLSCVANEIALHAPDGMVKLSRVSLTIEMPEF